MTKLKKGVAYAVIGIVALVGVIGVLGALSYQSQIGSEVVETTAGKYQQDDSVQKLEYTKAMVLQNLRFSALNAELDIARNGGSLEAVTYWCCNGRPQPVSDDEFLAALGNVTKSYVDTYIVALQEDTFLKEKEITVSEPKCVSVALPEGPCDHTNCLHMGAGLLDQKIEVDFPVPTAHKGPLEINDIGMNRIPHHLNTFQDLFEDNKWLSIITSSMAENCDQPDALKIQIAYKDLCKEIIKKLDPDNPEYIQCNIIETGAPHQDCTRAVQEQTCLSGLQFQSAGRSILINVNDTKFHPLADGKHVEWNLRATFEAEGPECTPINY